MKYPFLLCSLAILAGAVSCSKNDDAATIKAGTYNGITHNTGSYAFSTPNGIETSQWDSTYADNLSIAFIGSDSIEFTYAGFSRVFKLNSPSDEYCIDCDPTKNLSLYSFNATKDSVFYHFNRYGGSGANYSRSEIWFSGKYSN